MNIILNSITDTEYSAVTEKKKYNLFLDKILTQDTPRLKSELFPSKRQLGACFGGQWETPHGGQGPWFYCSPPPSQIYCVTRNQSLPV